MELKFALIGCGRIAKRHSELLGFRLIENACLVAVCDIKIERARAIGEQFAVPYYSDMYEMLSHENIDVAVILTESGLHADHVVAVAQYGKHVIVEKPMALTLSDADRMIDACDSSGVRLFVVKQNRFNVPVIKLREALDAGRFGKLVMGTVRVRWCRTQQYYDQDSWRGTWAMDGGVLANQASHHIDMLEWMMGDVESVFAMSRTALVNIEAEDTAVVALRFCSGALGIVEATTATRPSDLEGSISILGERGTVEIAGFAVNKMRAWQFSDAKPGDEEALKLHSVNPPSVYGFGHHEYYNNVVSAILHNKRQLVDGLQGRKSLELISAIYDSIETGLPVQMKFRPNRCRLGGTNG